jgi:hypothetical protein
MTNASVTVRNIPSLYKRLYKSATIDFEAMVGIGHHWQLRQQAANMPLFNTKNAHFCFARPDTQPLPQDARLLYNPTHLDRQYTFYGLDSQWRLVDVVVPTPKAMRTQASDQILAYIQRHPNVLQPVPQA